MTEKSTSTKQELIYWIITFCYLAFPILFSVIIETESHLLKRITYNLIAILGLLLPFALFPKFHKTLLLLYIPIYIIYWLNLCHMHIFKSPLLYTSVQIALDSNLQETKEFILNFGSRYCCAMFILYTFIAAGFLTFLLTRSPSPKRSAKLIFFYIIALGFAIDKKFHTLEYSRYQFIPYRVIRSATDYYHDLRELIKLQQEHKIPEITGLKSHNTPHQKETYIIVIGESASRQHLGYYGYNRPTTPFSSQQIIPFIFNRVRSPHASTLLSLRDSLTFAHKDDIKGGLKKGSLVNIFNQAGFKTFWFSNQYSRGKHDSLTSVLAHDATQIKFINNDKSFISLIGRDSHHDEDLLPLIQQALQDGANKKLIFVHLAGSHTAYSYRFPEKFDIFKEHNQNAFTREFDDYDNSIRYTDFILSEIVNKTTKLKEPSFVLYFSDHGDDVGLNEDSCHCHTANLAQTKDSMYEIPFLLWFNNAYKKLNKALISKLPNYTNRHFINHNLIHSLPTLAGLSFDLQENSKNLFCDEYIPEQP